MTSSTERKFKRNYNKHLQYLTDYFSDLAYKRQQYRPKPLKRIYIPKANDKKRPLCIRK